MPRHGTVSMLIDGCNCPECRETGRRRRRKQRSAARLRYYEDHRHDPGATWHFCMFCRDPFPTEKSMRCHEFHCDD